jgi:hypothetical protein
MATFLYVLPSAVVQSSAAAGKIDKRTNKTVARHRMVKCYNCHSSRASNIRLWEKPVEIGTNFGGKRLTRRSLDYFAVAGPVESAMEAEFIAS